MTPTDRIDRLQAAYDAATKGEWKARKMADDSPRPNGWTTQVPGFDITHSSNENHAFIPPKENAEFIALAHNEMAWLLEQARIVEKVETLMCGKSGSFGDLIPYLTSLLDDAKRWHDLPDSPTWPIVLDFALKMEAKLAKNRHKGDAEGWRKDSMLDLYQRAGEELVELAQAIEFATESPSQANADWVDGEAADVANFAMMIADVASRLARSEPMKQSKQKRVKVDPRIAPARLWYSGKRIPQGIFMASTFKRFPTQCSYHLLDSRDYRELLRDAKAMRELRDACKSHKSVAARYAKTVLEQARCGKPSRTTRRKAK